MKDADLVKFLIIFIIIMFLVGLGMLAIQDRKYHQRLEMQAQEAKDAAVDNIRGNYRVVELKSLRFDYNDDLGLWDLTEVNK